MNILIIPSDISNYFSSKGEILYNNLKNGPIDFAKAVKGLIFRGKPFNQEVQYIGDIPLVDGIDTVFTDPNYRFYLREQINVPNDCPYPSLFGMVKPSIISRKKIISLLKNKKIDAVLISIRGGNFGDIVRELSLEKKIFVAIFDVYDIDLYTNENYHNKLLYGLKEKKDYNVYFKVDIPKGMQTETLLPLGPIPVRPETCKFPKKEKDIDVFFSGRVRGKNHPDRDQTLDVIKELDINSMLLTHNSRFTFPKRSEYESFISRSKIVHCPSGRRWESFKFGEVAMAQESWY